jgi:hypothetical protein
MVADGAATASARRSFCGLYLMKECIPDARNNLPAGDRSLGRKIFARFARVPSTAPGLMPAQTGTLRTAKERLDAIAIEEAIDEKARRLWT